MPTKERPIRERLRTLLYFATAFAVVPTTSACSSDTSPSSLFQSVADWRLAEDIAKRLVGACPVITSGDAPAQKICPPSLVPVSGSLLVEYEPMNDVAVYDEPDAVELDSAAFHERVLSRAAFTGDYTIEYEGSHTVLRMKTRTGDAVGEMVLVIHRGSVVGAVVPWKDSAS